MDIGLLGGGGGGGSQSFVVIRRSTYEPGAGKGVFTVIFATDTGGSKTHLHGLGGS